MQALPSLQLSGVPGVQAPFWHVSMPSQTLALPLAMPFCTAAWTHPLLGLHESSVHWLPSLQSAGPPLVHDPATHVSFVVHGLPSLQVLPSGFTGFEQVPVVELQTPTA